MNVYENHYIPRQKRDASLLVIPSAPEYAGQMARCHQLGYGYPAGISDPEVLDAAKFRQHLKVFPEGQFIALDRTSGEVVGLTVSMRVNASLNKHSARSWAATTGDG